MAAIGVLCARVRVEEKQLIAALAEAGAVAMPVPPAPSPLPPGPTPPTAASGIVADTDVVEEQPSIALLIDRCQNRAIAEATLPIWRSRGVTVLDAGLAATGTRLQIAQALAAVGLPRPSTLLACTEETALVAAERFGYPATLLPLTPGSTTVPLYDRDTAEAVIEHRVVLGDAHEAISLIQAGLPGAEQRVLIHVAGGTAVAVDEAASEVSAESLDLAERTAGALAAAIIAVAIVQTAVGPVVWDVQPIAEFRHARALGEQSLAGAIARLASAATAGVEPKRSLDVSATGDYGREVGDGVRGVALSA